MQSRMTIKGQVTIPQPVRRRLGLEPGCIVRFVENAAGETVVPPAATSDAATQRVAAFRRGLERLRASPIDWGMTPDEYMAGLRDPVVL